MREKYAYESGARKYPARIGPDPSDAFSQDAAANKPPAGGIGNSEAESDAGEMTRHSDGTNVAGSGR